MQIQFEKEKKDKYNKISSRLKCENKAEKQILIMATWGVSVKSKLLIPFSK